MNVDRILATVNQHSVRYLLIGGMNFLLRHKPILTYDVDIWIEDTPENRQRCEAALASLSAEWGETAGRWGPVAELPGGWLERQPLFSLTSPHGSLDVFRVVTGLVSWQEAFDRAREETTASGVPYCGLSDADMLRSQEALDEAQQKPERMAVLREALERAQP